MFYLNRIINMNAKARKIIIGISTILSAVWLIGMSYIYFDQLLNHEKRMKWEPYYPYLSSEYFNCRENYDDSGTRIISGGRIKNGGKSSVMYNDNKKAAEETIPLISFSFTGYFYLVLLPLCILWLFLIFLLWPRQILQRCMILAKKINDPETPLIYRCIGVWLCMWLLTIVGHVCYIEFNTPGSIINYHISITIIRTIFVFLLPIILAVGSFAVIITNKFVIAWSFLALLFWFGRSLLIILRDRNERIK